MTLEEAIGVHNCDVDDKTGKSISHEEKYGRIIEFLGGLDVVKHYIPFTFDDVFEAIQKDKFLNNLPMYAWDRAAGFFTDNKGRCDFIGTGLWTLYREHGITSASCSEGVCILKEAARLIWKRKQEQEDWT